jgi:hypothetical protein
MHMDASPWPPLGVAVAYAVLVGTAIWAGAGVARAPSLSAAHRTLGAVVALLVLPGALLALSLGATETAQAVAQGAWVWPLSVAAAALQSVAAWRAQRTPTWLALPVVLWNLVAVLDATARTGDAFGVVWPAEAVPALAAPRAAWTAIIGADALRAAWPLVVPMLAPTWPTRLRWAPAGRVAWAIAAWLGAGATVLGAVQLWPVVPAYAAMGNEPLRERPGGDFALGLSAFGLVRDLPPAARARADDATLDMLEATALHVSVSVLARPAALDSLARLLDARRRVGSVVLATLEDLDRVRDDSAYAAQVVQRLGAATYVVSGDDDTAPVDRWAARVVRRATAVRAARPRVGTAVAVALNARQSARHAWAAAPGSAVDEIVLVTRASAVGAPALAQQWDVWSQWIAETGSLRSYWLLGAGGSPAAHGVMSQRSAVRGALAWATAERHVRGAIVADAGDHGAFTGVRTATLAWRPVAGTLLRTARVLRDMRTPTVAPAPADSGGG